MRFLFNIVTSAFYAEYMIADGSYGDVDAAEFIEPTPAELDKYHKATPPAGQQLGTVNGRPGWVDLPPLSSEESAVLAEVERIRLLSAADAIMLDWRTELALGEISDNDRRKLSLWLDYKKQVKAVDVSTAYSWPKPPEA